MSQNVAKSVESARDLSRSRRNPLAASTFLLRNLGKTLPLMGVILLAILLISGIVSLMNSIPHSIRTIYAYSRNFVAVTPRGDPAMPPRFVKRIEANAPVPIERIILCRATGRQVHSIVGKWPFANIGLKPEDQNYYLKKMGMRRLTGRLPSVGAAEAVISGPVAKNLRLKIGDRLQGPDTQDAYSPFEVTVVGLVESDHWIIVGDYDYQRINHFPPVDGVLAFAENLDDQAKLDSWALEEFKGERAQVLAFEDLNKDTDEMFRILYKILNVVIATLVAVITIMMGMLINIHQSQRLVEFGLLQALGYTKRELIIRIIKESAWVVVVGWIMGIAASYGLLVAVDQTLMQPSAFAMNTVDLVALAYTIPIPVSIFVVSIGSVLWRFRSFDPVGVVERRLV